MVATAINHEGEQTVGKYEHFSAKGYGVLRNRLSEVASAQGWEIASLAREAKVSYDTVERLWNKDARGVFLDTLHRIVATLEVSLDEIFPITRNENPDGDR